jgi:prolipoprotein diacylglyceryltransferase
VILAQGIGRWGNFMNHEAYGCAKITLGAAISKKVHVEMKR